MNVSLRERLESPADGLSVRFDEPMASHTTYKVGGRADIFAEVTSEAGLVWLLDLLARTDTPYVVVGNGSNVLFADAGFRGAVLHLGRGLDTIDARPDAQTPDHLEVGAALSITRLLRYAKDHALAGLECLGGVPGTLGGAVRMNAGTRLGELSEALVAARIVVPGEGARWLPASELGLSYRHSELPVGAVVTAARLKVSPATPAMWERLDDVLAYRKSTQPLTMPSCGSVFANPPGDSAGRLIEAAGLKGFTLGGAQVSEQHANWIVNTGSATAHDVAAVMDHCVAEVARRFDVTLRPEVKRLGDWSQPPAPVAAGGAR